MLPAAQTHLFPMTMAKNGATLKDEHSAKQVVSDMVSSSMSKNLKLWNSTLEILWNPRKSVKLVKTIQFRVLMYPNNFNFPCTFWNGYPIPGLYWHRKGALMLQSIGFQVYLKSFFGK